MATRLFGSQTSLREANRANLLASIHKFGAMTQVELAEVTGLSTATVSTLVHQLVDEDQLETKSTVRNGRRATLVTLARHQGLGVGLWIARRHLTLSIVDFSKSIIAEHTLPLPLGHKADTTLERAMLLINETLSSIDAGRTGGHQRPHHSDSRHSARMGRRRYHVPVAHGVQRSRIRR